MAASNSLNQKRAIVIVRRYRDLADAFVGESILDSAAVECFLADENTIRMDWFWSNLLGGIKLCVKVEDFDSAASLLDQSVPEKFNVEGVGEYLQPRCPVCQSLEVSFQGLNQPVDYIRVLFGGPLQLHRSLWECDSCGHRWPESSEKPPENLLTAMSSILLILIALANFGAILLSIVANLHYVMSRW